MAHPAYYVGSTGPIGLLTVKTVYRAKMAIGEILEERKKRFSELWDDALAEAKK